MNTVPLLEIDNLSVELATERGPLRAVSGVSLSLGASSNARGRRRIWLGQDHTVARRAAIAAAGCKGQRHSAL